MMRVMMFSAPIPFTVFLANSAPLSIRSGATAFNPFLAKSVKNPLPRVVLFFLCFIPNPNILAKLPIPFKTWLASPEP